MQLSQTRNRPRLTQALLIAGLVLGLTARIGAGAAGSAGSGSGPSHLLWAHRLIDGVTPATNEYASHPTIVTWTGVAGSGETRNRSVCSSLVAHLMMQAYGYNRADFKRWMHTTFPQAADFHNAIAAGNGFDRVTTVAAIRPGDVVAIRYPPGHHPTGHVLVVAAPPAARAATEPAMAGTTQYELRVIDSSRSGHGPLDTRHFAKGRYHSGVGEGTMRLYVDPSGAVVAYAWSLTKASEIYTPDQRHLVIGRLNGKVAPAGGPDAAAAAAAEEPEGDVEPPA